MFFKLLRLEFEKKLVDCKQLDQFVLLRVGVLMDGGFLLCFEYKRLYIACAYERMFTCQKLPSSDTRFKFFELIRLNIMSPLINFYLGFYHQPRSFGS